MVCCAGHVMCRQAAGPGTKIPSEVGAAAHRPDPIQWRQGWRRCRADEAIASSVAPAADARRYRALSQRAGMARRPTSSRSADSIFWLLLHRWPAEPCRNDHLRRRRNQDPPHLRGHSAARRGRLCRHAQGRPADGRGAGPAGRPRQAGRDDGRARPHGLRVRDGPPGDPGDALLQGLPALDLHLDQPRRLPRHPRGAAAARGRHRQYRPDADRRRLVRRQLAHVSRWARFRARPSG